MDKEIMTRAFALEALGIALESAAKYAGDAGMDEGFSMELALLHDEVEEKKMEVEE